MPERPPPRVPSQEEPAGNVEKHLKTFDELDFEVFSGQRWDLLDRSHAKNVRVIWPDGHETQGIETHIKDLATMFVFMPDLRIKTHPVAFGAGEWTAAIGVMEGTFTKPMPVPGGKPIPPNNRKLKLNMCTIARWKDGRIVDEYLFWDSGAYMRQLGLTA